MTEKKTGSITAFCYASLAAFTLTGCSIASPPDVTLRAPNAEVISDFEMTQESDASGLRAEFASSLTSAFSAHGVSAKKGSRWVADFAVSAQPATMAVVPVGKESEFADGTQADVFKAKWYHKCEPERVRGTLAIFDRDTTTLAAKSEAHIFACPGDISELDTLASMLVRTVTNNAGSGAAFAQE